MWRKSSYSTKDGECVEVALETAAVAVRDSKAPAEGVLDLRPEEWRAFLDRLS